MGSGGAVPIGSPITLVFVDLVHSTALKAALPGSDVTARNRAYFDTILTPYRQRVEADLANGYVTAETAVEVYGMDSPQ